MPVDEEEIATCIVCDKTPESGSLFCHECNDAIKPVEDVEYEE